MALLFVHPASSGNVSATSRRPCCPQRTRTGTPGVSWKPLAPGRVAIAKSAASPTSACPLVRRYVAPPPGPAWRPLAPSYPSVPSWT